MNKKILLLLPALALVLGGCNPKKNSSASGSDSGTSSQTVAVESVELNKTSATLDPGETLQLTAVAKPSTLPDKSVKWSSNNPAVATVSSGGLVTAVADGTAKIKAAANADETKFAECTIAVNKKQVIVASETADTEKTFKLGCWQDNLGSYYYFKGSVDSNTRGETTTAWADGVDVKLEQVGGQYKVKILGSNKYFEMTDDHHFQVAETPTILWDWNNTAKTVTRTISSTTYFPGTYNQFDTISGCDISMLAGDFVFQFLYKIDAVDPTSVDILEASADVNKGATVQLHATCSPIGASESTVVWSIAEDNAHGKVSVSESGLVTAAADAVVGETVTVKATWGTLPGDTCVVTVKGAITLVDSPVVSTLYRFGMKTSAATDKDDDVYSTGAESGNYGASTTDWNAAATFELIEVSTGNYKVKVTQPDSTVKYLAFAVSGTYTNIKFKDAVGDGSVFTYNSTYKTLVFNATGHSQTSYDGDYFFGTYTKSGSTYTTLSCSKMSYLTAENLDVTQFPAHFWIEA